MKIILNDGTEIVPTESQKGAIDYVLNYYKMLPVKRMSLDDLYDVVAKYMNIPNFDERRRKRELLYPRQLFSLIGHKALGYTAKEVGDRIGGLDHSSTLHSIDRIRKLLAVEEEIRKDLDNICAIIGVVNPIVYQMPKKPETLKVIVPKEEAPPPKPKEPKKQPLIRPQATYTNRNYLEEYGV